MVPMFDPMMPEVTLLFAISPAFAGVVMALVGAAALAIASALGELRRPRLRGGRVERHMDTDRLAAAR